MRFLPSHVPHAGLLALALAALALSLDRPGPAVTPSVRSGLPMARATIAGRLFMLEVADDELAQTTGLAGRTSLGPRDGMLFTFDPPAEQEFVMRDCSIPIDLLYADEHGRIISLHSMQPEAPRGPGERATHALEDFAYTARLRPYPSGAPCAFAIEVRGGSIDALGVRPGDRVSLDLARPTSGLSTR